jgi:hypothetical protein
MNSSVTLLFWMVQGRFLSRGKCSPNVWAFLHGVSMARLLGNLRPQGCEERFGLFYENPEGVKTVPVKGWIGKAEFSQRKGRQGQA